MLECWASPSRQSGPEWRRGAQKGSRTTSQIQSSTPLKFGAASNKKFAAAFWKWAREGNVTFAAYAAIRIRGAILDELLRQDSMSRWNLAKAKRLGSAVSKLKQEKGEQFLAGFSLVGFLQSKRGRGFPVPVN